MPTVIDTSTSATATQGFNQRKVDRCQDGTLWAVVSDAGAQTAEFWYSKDNGATWTQGSGSTITGTEPRGSLFIDLDDYAHYVYKAVAGTILYQRGTPNAGRTAWTWSAAQTLFTAAPEDYPDVVAHREGAGWEAHAVASYADSGFNYTIYRKVAVSSGGGFTLGTRTQISADYSVASAHTYPSIDFHHTGDGKTVAGGTPHLYVWWDAGATGAGKGIRFRKAVYSGGAWAWNAEREIDTNAKDNWLSRSAFFDGTRAVLAGVVQDAAAANTDLRIYDRDAADTATTSRLLIDNVGVGADLLAYGSATYDSAGNVYLFGRDGTGAAGTRKLNWRKWTRASASLSAITTFDTTGSDTPYISVKRGYSSASIDWVWTDGTVSPYSVTFDRISLNNAPNAPTLTSPVTGSTVDLDATNRFGWTFSDPDSGDSQSKYDLRYRIGAGAWTDLTGTTPNQFRDITAGTFTAGSYEWQVRTYDAAGVVGPYSASSFFTAATSPSPPSLTAPISGETIAAAEYLVTWTTPSQEAYQLRTVADLAGAADTATVYTDTGEIVSTTARSRLVPFATNNRYEHVQHRIKAGGLWSAWSSVRVLVSYTPPATPTLELVTDDTLGTIYLLTANPTPGAGEPTVSSHDIYRRETAVGGDGIRLIAAVAAGTHEDRTPASGVDYEYRAKANGANGTYTHSEWVGAAAEVEAGIYGSGGY